MARTSRRSRPVLDGLEGRQLLNARMGHNLRPALVGAVNNPTGAPIITGETPRWLGYITPGGAQVEVGVLGSGIIQGSSVDPDGALNLVYGGTNAASKILINVGGGDAPLRSVRNANLPSADLTGVGGQLLGSLLAPNMDLVANGDINLTSGIGRLQIHSAGPNTQIHLRELPQTVQGSSSSSNSNVNATTLGSITASGAGTTNLTPTGVTSSFTTIPTLLPGETAIAAGSPATSTAPTSYSASGRSFTYSNDANGGSTLTSVSGQFVPTGNLVVSPAPTPPATDPAPPGVIVQVGQINAGPGAIGDGEVFGYDPTLNALVRFDARTGAALRSIAVGGAPTTAAGVGLGRDGRELVVLLGRGSTVQAFDASTGAPVGQFSAANLGLNHVEGIAFTGPTTVLSDPTFANTFPGGGVGYGVAVGIDVTASLASGAAQPTSIAFYNDRESVLSGDATGVAGSDNVFSLISAHFDSFEPAQLQLGVSTINAQNPQFRQVALTAFSNPDNKAGVTPYIIANGTNQAQPLGSIDGLIALDTGVTNGANVLNLYSPAGVGLARTLKLADANPLAGLSESFHPELLGSALVDVQGNVQSFNAGSARGLALNDAGNLNLVKIVRASDSTIVGQPVGHLILVSRQDVTVESPTRAVGARQGVVVDPTLPVLGPLSLPS